MYFEVNRQNFRDTVDHRTGADGMAYVYDQLVNGKADPASGFIVSMSETT